MAGRLEVPAHPVDIEVRAVWAADIEIRQRGRNPVVSGAFPYGSVATVADRGRVRKETFHSRAFRFAVDDFEREINLLYGHQLGQPLAARSAGTLTLADSADALRFEAELPPEDRQPTWIRDAVLAHEAGLIRGISPGFRVPPRSAVPDAEEFVPEPGNPGVSIRVIRQAVLFELSLVSRPAYDNTTVDLRSLDSAVPREVAHHEAYRWL